MQELLMKVLVGIMIASTTMLVVNFTRNYNIMIIPSSVGERRASMNDTIPDYDVECYRHTEFDYCTFPKSNYSLFYPQGGSMLPFFSGNNEILLCDHNFTLIENSIYAFNYSISPVPVVHRCVRLTDTGCIFKGDNNEGTENVTTEQVICKVDWLVRKIK